MKYYTSCYFSNVLVYLHVLAFVCEARFALSNDAFFLVDLIHYLRGPISNFFSKNNFKTRSHDTIHTFKNYFVIVFLVFSNKWYLNRLSRYYVLFLLNIYKLTHSFAQKILIYFM